ncbi:MAG: hypothetical protein SFV17_27835 [Candidatus Obscuribacter sp.]|nr:hypothetical protein [Candidatus Obscuribacter sp.]
MRLKVLLALAAAFAAVSPVLAEPGSPVVAEFFAGTRVAAGSAKKSVAPGDAFFSALKKAFPNENLILLRESGEVSGLSRTTADFLTYRSVSYRMTNKLPLNGEPLLILDGIMPVKSDSGAVSSALAKLKQERRQPMKLEAVRSKERIKVKVDVVFREHFSEGTRILLLVMESAPVPAPVLQTVDLGYLTPGHRGSLEQVLKLDRSWLEGRAQAPLRVVALLQREDDKRILSAAQAEVAVKTYALF